MKAATRATGPRAREATRATAKAATRATDPRAREATRATAKAATRATDLKVRVVTRATDPRAREATRATDPRAREATRVTVQAVIRATDPRAREAIRATVPREAAMAADPREAMQAVVMIKIRMQGITEGPAAITAVRAAQGTVNPPLRHPSRQNPPATVVIRMLTEMTVTIRETA